MNSNDALKLNETTMMFEVPYTNKTNRLTRLVTIIDNAKSNVVVYVEKNYVDLLAALVTNAFKPEKNRRNEIKVYAVGREFRRSAQTRTIEAFNTSAGLNVLIIDYLDRAVLNSRVVINYETGEKLDNYIFQMEKTMWIGIKPCFLFNFIKATDRSYDLKMLERGLKFYDYRVLTKPLIHRR